MLNKYLDEWGMSNLETNARYTNITHESSHTPMMIWTGNQGSSEGPYPIVLSDQSLPKSKGYILENEHRRSVIQNQNDLSSLCIEWGDIEAVKTNGETFPIDFVACDPRITLVASNSMDYLATESVVLPGDVDKIRFKVQVFTNTMGDTLKKVETEFKAFNVDFGFTDKTDSKYYSLSESFSDPKGSIQFEQEMVVDVSQLAGHSIELKPQLTGLDLSGNQYDFALGKIWIIDEEGLPKSANTQTKTLIPVELALLQNYPNPGNPNTTIQFQLPKSDNVELKIMNVLGQEVKVLVDEQREPGVHTVVWDGKDRNGKTMSSGVYIYLLKVGDKVLTKKLTLIK